ncbi:protein SMG7 [Pseudohyphozyma bogoriensis]|nr:protein SMG7 [Pseudohyphozyma bogoriensis]
MDHSTRTPLAGTSTTLRKESSGINSFIRDAKGQKLKAVLKKKDPWDREVEFQREALRKVYLQILFAPSAHATSNSTLNPAPPPSSSSKPSTSHTSRLLNVLNLLWLETSHSMIHIYRAKVSEMEKTLADNPNAHRGSRGRGGGGGPGGRFNAIPGPTARRRLIHSFRTFLAAEEEFFRVLIARFAKSLYPTDIVGLRSLGVTVEEGDGGEEEELSEEEKKNRRNAAVPLAHKALIFFGDIARYRELYSEPGAGAPNAALAGGAGKEGRRGKGGAKGDSGERKVKNWGKAAECYLQARLLLPDNGNPSNQLAVLSQYASDFISSTYHYYRALSVRSPFPTARTNLEIAYSKAISRYFAEDGGEPEGDEGVKFQAAFVALHGLYFTKTRIDEIPVLANRVQELFQVSVEQRLLPSDLIVKSAVTGLCALWDARMFRSGGNKAAKKPSQETSQDSSTPSSAAPSINLEPHILIHVLSLFRVLCSIGTQETTELVAQNIASGVHENVEDGSTLALNISAVLRRALPAIRILSKWIMGQLEYISRVEARVEAKEKKHGLPTNVGAQVALDDLKGTLRVFWAAYADFANAVLEAFPFDLLPSAVEDEVWLEEDVDMLGFAPLRRGMKEGVAAADGMPVEIARVGKDVHPNEEQLMRIGDIEMDARLIAEAKESLVTNQDGMYVFQDNLDLEYQDTAEAEEVALASERLSQAFGIPAAQLQRAVDDLVIEEEDEEYEGYEMTEDDPVDLAMRIGTGDGMELDDDEEEDDDEEIVYSGLSNSQLLASAPPPGLGAPTHTPPGLPPVQNASGLLLQVLNGGVPATTASPPAPAPTRSIWGPGTSTALPPANASNIESFESLPNTTHQALAPGGGQPRGSFSSPPVPHPPQSIPPPPSLYGNFSPFGHPPSRTLPPPHSLAPAASDLSPLANPFTGSPGNSSPFGTGAHSGGWPAMAMSPSNQQYPAPASSPYQHHNHTTGAG